LPIVDFFHQNSQNQKTSTKNQESSYITADNFMMTGHNFSSSFSGNHQNPVDVKNDAPYNSDIVKSKTSKLRGKLSESAARPKYKFHKNQSIFDDTHRSNVHTAKATINEESYGKSRNPKFSANMQNLQKLKTSSWLFSKRQKSRDKSTNSYAGPVNGERETKSRSQFLKRRNLSRRSDI